MSSIKCAFIPQGLVIGELTEEVNGSIRIKNPALIISRQESIAFANLLQLVEENEITVKREDIAFNCTFTPKTEILNHYTRLFGSGIQIVSDTNVLKF